MIGDTLVITDYHRAAADRVLSIVLERLESTGRPVSVSIAGESGSGKSEIAACLAEALESKGRGSLVLGQDDYFRLPPRSNHERRQQGLDWVGPGEVHLDLMSAHVAALRQRPVDPIEKPLVDFAANAIGTETVDGSACDVVIAEGTYTTLLDDVDVRVFIDRTYRQTRKARLRRNRDPDSTFIEQVLEIEHEIIAPHRELADVVIGAPEGEG